MSAPRPNTSTEYGVPMDPKREGMFRELDEMNAKRIEDEKFDWMRIAPIPRGYEDLLSLEDGEMMSEDEREYMDWIESWILE